MTHGGYLTLLGVPALIATIANIGRIQWANSNLRPHGYGRTNLIYWPTQAFIVLAALILISLLIALEWHHSSSDGMFAGVLLALVACVSNICVYHPNHGVLGQCVVAPPSPQFSPFAVEYRKGKENANTSDALEGLLDHGASFELGCPSLRNPVILLPVLLPCCDINNVVDLPLHLLRGEPITLLDI